MEHSKQAQEVVLSCKTKRLSLLLLVQIQMIIYIHQKHLGIILDSKLKFENYVKMLTTKINKIIGLLRKFGTFKFLVFLKAIS